MRHYTLVTPLLLNGTYNHIICYINKFDKIIDPHKKYINTLEMYGKSDLEVDYKASDLDLTKEVSNK